MKKRGKKAILRKIDAWRDNPVMMTGIYRLLVYLEWDDIPEIYQEFFKEDHKKEFIEKGASTLEFIEQDVELYVKTIFNELNKGNVVMSFSLIPPLLADLFVMGKGTDQLQARFIKIVDEYTYNWEFSIQFANMEALVALADLVTTILSRMKIDLDLNLYEISDKILITSPHYVLDEEEEETKLSDETLETVSELLKLDEERGVKEES